MVRGRPLRYCPLSRKAFSPPAGKMNIASCVFCSTHPLLPQKTLALAGGAIWLRSRKLQGRGITAARPQTGSFHLLMTASMNEQQQHPKRRKGGRTPKSAPAFHRETVNLDAAQHARFLTLYEQSGLSSKSKFIAARIFAAFRPSRSSSPRASSATASGSYAPTGARWSMWPDSPPCTSSTAPSG